MKKQGMEFIVITVCLVLISAFCITGTVFSKTKASKKAMENYYRQQESELVKEARAYLDREGYKNSGVMLTKVIEEDDSREYTLTVHHSKIDSLEDTQKEALKKELASLSFTAENCTFCQEFLVTD